MCNIFLAVERFLKFCFSWTHPFTAFLFFFFVDHFYSFSMIRVSLRWSWWWLEVWGISRFYMRYKNSRTKNFRHLKYVISGLYDFQKITLKIRASCVASFFRACFTSSYIISIWPPHWLHHLWCHDIERNVTAEKRSGEGVW